ncbi:MAG: bifunctional DNA-formamidopyrimidine glycosylase/DNA-(apurinic or apyrimidinic site) lyase [Planctomycetes bacterium]|nr:bifunctional DNA-formamidopyrimidine glycosylase/DNA-(apurinic or apyrimidinic site) lyase [Planctomycetota bacterium]
MPELPEVENLKRTLEPLIVGAKVHAVRLFRRDIVRFHEPNPHGRSIYDQLLLGRRIASLRRRGKQLAIIADDGSTLRIQLGMSGQLRYLRHRQRLDRNDHVHCVWQLSRRATRGRLVFRDPRRFGRLTAFASFAELESSSWAALGPEAITIRSHTLRQRLSRTRRAIKSALLDQHIIAGIGNIYADEALFTAQIHPESRADKLPHDASRTLAKSIRSILQRAILSGGSTIRDYTDALGRNGSFASEHQVYGRAGQLCVRCTARLVSRFIGQRSTVFCPHCQHLLA